MELNVLTQAEALYWANRCLIDAGRPQVSRGRPTREIQNFTVHIRHVHLDALNLGGRNAKPAIAAVEALQLVGQVAAPETMHAITPNLSAYFDDGIGWGAYGQRVYSQLARAERLLKDDLGTRQAVLSIYDGQRDLGVAVKDIPCTLTIQFMWEGEALAMRVSMRSNDAWLGLPYDLFQFSALQMAMADALDVKPGGYTHTVGSMHLYDDNFEQALRLEAPSEPEAYMLNYTKHWVGDSIGDISSRARGLLAGFPFNDSTPFEQRLAVAIGGAL